MTPATSVELNLLDELFLNLDRADEPWTVHFEVRVGERVDADRLIAAIAVAAQRHPIARASLAAWRYTDRRYMWEIAEALPQVPLEEVQCDDDAALGQARERLFSTSPSLEAAPPFTVLLAHGPAGDSILLNLHHGAGDGMAAARLMTSMLRAYAGAEDPLPAQDPLGVRDVRALAGTATLEERLERARALARRAIQRRGLPTRLARDGASDRPGYGFVLADLSAEETNAVLARRGVDTTVNDALLAALAVTIHRWNDEHGRGTGRIALSMPVNLRPHAWRTEIVGNFASYATVSLGPSDSVDPARALAAVATETGAIKRDGLAGSIVDMLAGSGKLTIAVKRRLPDLITIMGNAAVDTASLSNLGVLGGLPVQAVWFSPPGRMPLGTAFGAVTLDGRLHLTLRYRHAQLDAAAANLLVARYREALTS
jgi:NRPS condensation-like uncharacterized protein